VRLRVIYPDGEELYKDVREVYLATPEGQIGILEGHVYFLGLSSRGYLEVTLNSGDKKQIPVDDGIVTVTGDGEREIKVLTTSKGELT